MRNNDLRPLKELEDGFAEHQGEGIFVVFQTDEFGEVQTVVLTRGDLQDMLGIPRD